MIPCDFLCFNGTPANVLLIFDFLCVFYFFDAPSGFGNSLEFMFVLQSASDT